MGFTAADAAAAAAAWLVASAADACVVDVVVVCPQRSFSLGAFLVLLQ